MDLRRQLEPRDPAVAGPTALALVAVGTVVTSFGAALGGPPAVALHLVLTYAVLYASSQLGIGVAAATVAAAIAVDSVAALRHAPPDQALGDVLGTAATLLAIAAVVVRKGLHRDAIIRALEEGKAALTEQATHDALTGLPNRVLFHLRLRDALEPSAGPTGATGPTPAAPGPVDHRAPAPRGGVAVLFCDLDGFKAVNDSLGHRAGDELLLAVADRLRARLRLDDVVARLGGDEFAVLVHDADHAAAQAVAVRLLSAFDDAFPVAGQHVHVGVSIGVTLARPDARPDVDALLREADVAMYEAKATGRGCSVVFTADMLAAQVEQASLVQDLHGAVARGEITVAYQPVADLVTGRVDGLEALARWTHPTRGPISPATFIPLAERTGLVGEIGAFVLAEAATDGPAFAAAAGRQVSIGVNVSASQLADGSILDLVPTGRTPDVQLLVEVTESTLLRADVVPVLEELRRRDVRIAMDDFGVGYSSIAALRLMPVDALKLDRAFTVDISTDPRAAAIVRAVSTMARELDLSLIAEGIETVEQRDALTSIGCRFGQGYLLARPMGAVAMCAHLGALRDRLEPADRRPPAGPAPAVSAEPAGARA